MKNFSKICIAIFGVMILVSCSGNDALSEKDFEDILVSENWKTYSAGNEVTYEFDDDGKGRYSYSEYAPNEFKWKMSENILSLTFDSGEVEYRISDDGEYRLISCEENTLYSDEDILIRERDFKEEYDFDDRLISKAKFDVFLIYNSNFSKGNFVEIYVTNIDEFKDIYTVSGKAQYNDPISGTKRGTFEIQYKYDGENIVEIDNYFSRPN